MDVRQLLSAQYRSAHFVANAVLADLPEAIVNDRLPGAEIQTIGTILAHAVASEDGIISRQLLGVTPLLAEHGPKCGFPPPEGPIMTPGWIAAVALNLEAFKAYVAAVFARAEEAIANAPESAFAREVDGPFGKSTLIEFIGTIGLMHVSGHFSEVAALKGVRGLKGLPF